MEKYSPPKTRKTQLVLVFCVFLALTFSACGTKKPAVTDTKPGSGKKDGSVTQQEPIKSMIEMVPVGGGMFNMGFPQANRRSYTGLRDPNPWPNHFVTLNDFYIGKYEVTQGQYIEVMGKDRNPSENTRNPEDTTPVGIEKGYLMLPVEHTTWYDTLVFCNKLSIKEKLKPVYSMDGSVDPDDWGETPLSRNRAAKWDSVKMDRGANGYRLPTEAEWEYAARGGAESRYFTYAGSNVAAEVAWYDPKDGRTSSNIHQVGSKKPNELDLYDMSGNVMEWCWDWDSVYPTEAQNNPVGPAVGTDKIIRGGGWSAEVAFCQVVSRHKNLPYFHAMNIGFRVARNK